MQTAQAIDYLPLWALFTATVLGCLFSVELGFRLGKYRRRRPDREQEEPVGTMVAATLGLLAFMLAFTFGMAESRFETRKQLVLDEANAIGTAYLRAELLSAPYNEEIRNLIRQYVDVRLEALRPGKVEQAIVKSESLQDELWSRTVFVAERDTRPMLVGLFIQSLNDVIDIHAKRVAAGLRDRIPAAIWTALYAVAGLSMGVLGYRTGLGGRRSVISTIVLAITFAAVMLLIADLDRPGGGVIKVSQMALVDVQNKFNMQKR